MSIPNKENLETIVEELKETMKSLHENVDRLKGIKRLLVREGLTQIAERLYCYPTAHIAGAVDKDNDWVGGSMYTVQDILDEVEEEMKEEEDEE